MASERKSKGPARIPLLEWIAAGSGLLLLLAMFAFLTVEAIKTGSGPPVLTVEPLAVTSSSGPNVVEINVRNHSRKTAAGVQLEGTLRDGTGDVETSSVTFDYVPGMSERKGAIIFTRDPREYRVELRVTGYERP